MTDYDKQIADLQLRRDAADKRVRLSEQAAVLDRATRSSYEARIKELADAKLAEQRAAAPAEPTPTDDDTTPVILFRKVFPGGVYTYAAIRAGREPRPWAFTQTGHAPPRGPFNWAQLLDFIGPEGWGNIRRLGSPTHLEIVGPAVPDEVDALGDDHIWSAWIDDDGDHWEYRDNDWHWREIGSTAWHRDCGIISPDSSSAPYKRAALVTDPLARIDTTHSYKGADVHGSEAPEWTLR